MIKLIFTILALLLATFCFAQKHALLITNPHAKDIVLEDGKRIRLKTTNGDKISGRMHIVDSQTIKIRKHIIPLQDITMIKRHPLAFTVFSSAVLGTVVVAGGGLLLIIAGFSNEPVYVVLAIIGVTPLVYAIVSEVNISHRKRRGFGYNYAIIDLPETPPAGGNTGL